MTPISIAADPQVATKNFLLHFSLDISKLMSIFVIVIGLAPFADIIKSVYLRLFLTLSKCGNFQSVQERSNDWRPWIC